MEDLGNMRKKLVLDIPRQDPNTMDIDRHKEARRCYNYRETGHLATRCSKLRKKRKEEMRIVEGVKKDFSLGRE